MMPKAEFLFDFGSPNAYLADQLIPGIEKRTGVRFDYVPILLGGVFKLTGNMSPAESLRGIRNKPEFMQRETERFLRRNAIATYRPNPHFPVNTLMLMRGAIAAQKEGVFDTYFKAAFHYMWEEPRKMDDSAVMRASLIEAGLDAERLMGRAQDAYVKDQLLENTRAAVERGVFGSPSFFVGSELFFGKDQLREVEEEILAQKAKAA